MSLEQPDARARSSDGLYVLYEEYTYLRPEWNVTIPEGFVWDGASVPRFLWSISGIRPDGRIRAAALVHDYLYRYGGKVPSCSRVFTRKEADRLFYEMIREAGGSWWTAWRAWFAVSLFGWLAWKRASK